MPQDIGSGPERKGGLLNQTRNFLFGENNENHNQIQNLTSDKGGRGKRLSGHVGNCKEARQTRERCVAQQYGLLEGNFI